MRPAVFLLLLSLLFAPVAKAQDISYVSDKQYIPLRSGPGGEYRITHKGIPSGTRLTIARTSSDGVWTEITTDRGTSGWIQKKSDPTAARNCDLQGIDRPRCKPGH